MKSRLAVALVGALLLASMAFSPPAEAHGLPGSTIWMQIPLGNKVVVGPYGYFPYYCGASGAAIGHGSGSNFQLDNNLANVFYTAYVAAGAGPQCEVPVNQWQRVVMKVWATNDHSGWFNVYQDECGAYYSCVIHQHWQGSPPWDPFNAQRTCCGPTDTIYWHIELDVYWGYSPSSHFSAIQNSNEFNAYSGYNAGV